MNDIQAPPIGTFGTVRCIDSMGTIHVNWDNGSSLGVILEAGDMIKEVDNEETL